MKSTAQLLHLDQQIVDSVSLHENELLATLSALVKIDTVNPYCGDSVSHDGEQRGQTFLARELEKAGFVTSMTEIPSTMFDGIPITAPKNRSYSNRYNLQGIRRYGSGGPTIILNGHMDTVGIEGMSIDPFSGSIADGKLFGRGASDDKAGLVGALYAVKALEPFAPLLAGTIVFQSVADEECSGSGAGTLALCKGSLHADMAIVVDGLDLEIQRASKGTMTMEVEVTGKAAHASEGEGINAIEKALYLKEAVDDFIDIRARDAPGYKVNFGVFSGGTVASVVPGSAKFIINIDYAHHEAVASMKQYGSRDGSQIRAAFSRMIFQKADTDPWLREHMPKVTCIKDLYPFETAEKETLVQTLADVFIGVKGTAPIISEGSWCDAAHLSAIAGIPSIVFGPLARGAVHGPEEYVGLQDLSDFTKILALALFRFLHS